ncbi:MAG: RNA polymerase sporulation sigma factor SigK [Bacilli bacterium]
MSFLIDLIKSLFFFTGSYSNNVFPDPLTSKEEEHYIELMKNGDKDARNVLIERNLRLVAHIVKKFESKNTNPDDLISIGTIGLIKGIDTFSFSKSTKITTYAAKCIENEILMYFRSNKKYLNNVGLNDAIGYDKEGNEISLSDVLKDNKVDIPLQVHNTTNIEKLLNYLSVLTKREKEIICLRYGLFDNDETTQKNIAKKMGISRSYVSRIEKRALTKLYKEFVKSKGIL